MKNNHVNDILYINENISSTILINTLIYIIYITKGITFYNDKNTLQQKKKTKAFF